jgi:hypothetical protein
MQPLLQDVVSMLGFMRATSSAGPGRQVESQLACRPAARGRPLHAVGCSPRPDRARHCAWIKKLFSISLIPKILANF